MKSSTRHNYSSDESRVHETSSSVESMLLDRGPHDISDTSTRGDPDRSEQTDLTKERTQALTARTEVRYLHQRSTSAVIVGSTSTAEFHARRD